MSEEFKRDIVGGQIIDWNKLSTKELRRLKEEYEQKEKSLLERIDKELRDDEDESNL